MSKKRIVEQNRIKGTRYRLRKRVADLGKAIEEQAQRLKSIRESGSPEDIERAEKNVVFAKKNAELFSQYKVENTLTKEQYNQKKAELKNSIFSTELERKRALARKKYYYKKRYGSEWQEAIGYVAERNLNIPFKGGTNE